MQANPTKAKNLDHLSNEQFSRLVQGIKENKIRVNSFKGTVLTDLLDYSNQLISNGSTSQAHTTNYLKTLLSQEHSPIKDNQKPKNNALLISGLIALGISALAICYYLGRKRKKK